MQTQSILSGEAHIAPPQLKRSQAWSHVQVNTSRCLRIMLPFGRGLGLTQSEMLQAPKRLCSRSHCDARSLRSHNTATR